MTGRARPEALRRCDILGVHIVAEPLDAVRTAVLGTLRLPVRDALCLCPVDAHCVVEAAKDPALMRFLNDAAFTVPDGMPLVRVARWMGFPAAERARGADVMWRVLEGTRDGGIGHFFLSKRRARATPPTPPICRGV